MSDHIGALQHAVATTGHESIEDLVLAELDDERVFLMTRDAMRELGLLVLDVDHLKSRLELCLAAVKSELSRRKTEMSEMQLYFEETYIPVRGYEIVRDVEERWSPKDGTDDDRAARWLRDNGYPDIAKTSIHWKKFNSTIKEILAKHEGQLPEDLDELVKVFEQPTVTIRKGR